MRSLMRSGFLAAVVLTAAVSLVAAQEASPAGALSGTFVGDRGGAYVVVEVDLPAATDVTITLEHWPCQTGRAIGINVWGPGGLLARSRERNACTQVARFNSGDGGKATIQAFNYLHGVGTWYSLSAEGITLPGAVAPAAAAEAPAAPAPAEAEAAPAEPVEAKVEAPAAAEAAPAPAPAAAVKVEGATVLGNLGGAYGVHELAVTAGHTYKVTMTYGLDRGGEWKSVGFHVWCPSGWAASGRKVTWETKQATFTAAEDGVCGIQVYNYHHGVTLFYSLEAGEFVAE